MINRLQGEIPVEKLKISFILFGILALSLVSGYHSIPISIEVAWAFSPLGWLEAGWGETWERWNHLETAHLFQGTLGLTPDYFFVFLKTCAMEAPFYFFLVPRLEKGTRSLLWANALTHPVVYFVIPLLTPSYLTSAVISEAFAPAIEMIYMIYSTQVKTCQRVLITAIAIILANLVSWQCGGFL